MIEDILTERLYKKQNKRFEKINELAKAFAVNYCGNVIIRESIFGIITNYAKRRDIPLEVLRYPFDDDELWAFTFIKKGTVFLCVNTDLIICKQVFAAAHELYHIHCYAEDIETETVIGGSLLDSKTVYEIGASQEDLEANAFAGLLLMPDNIMVEQVKMYGISEKKISVDDVLTLMELFALPYKAVTLRLVENSIITESKARELLKVDSSIVIERINLTGKALSWQRSDRLSMYFGSLLENMKYNADKGLLTDNRKKSDKEYLERIRKELRDK